jgi:hypothetical protein
VRLPAAASSAGVPSQLVVGEGAVWVLTSIEGPTRLGSRVDAGLVRIDPHTNRVSATTPLANLDSKTHQAQLAVGAGGVWVEGQHLQDGLARAVIDRVDPANGRLSGTIEAGDLSPATLAAGFGALWLLRPTTEVRPGSGGWGGVILPGVGGRGAIAGGAYQENSPGRGGTC